MKKNIFLREGQNVFRIARICETTTNLVISFNEPKVLGATDTHITFAKNTGKGHVTWVLSNNVKVAVYADALRISSPDIRNGLYFLSEVENDFPFYQAVFNQNPLQLNFGAVQMFDKSLQLDHIRSLSSLSRPRNPDIVIENLLPYENQMYVSLYFVIHPFQIPDFTSSSQHFKFPIRKWELETNLNDNCKAILQVRAQPT